MDKTRLGVNVDHIATVREARKAIEPNPITAALMAELAGAHGITVHLRGDRRHVQDDDVKLLRKLVTTCLNVEMAVTEEMLEIALAIVPDTVTFVPEREEEITTEGGLDVAIHEKDIADAVVRLRKIGVAVSLFVDPEKQQIEAAAKTGSHCVEINTAA